MVGQGDVAEQGHAQVIGAGAVYYLIHIAHAGLAVHGDVDLPGGGAGSRVGEELLHVFGRVVVGGGSGGAMLHVFLNQADLSVDHAADNTGGGRSDFGLVQSGGGASSRA